MLNLELEKDIDESLPEELRQAWQRDRDKKAEKKRQRELDRMEAALDLFTSKSGKKARKAIVKAARNEDNDGNAFDAPSLIKRIRAFVGNIGGPSSMSLPPMAKGDRAKVHNIARAFGLKSASKGNGKARFTTLTKTSYTGINLNERWINQLQGMKFGRNSDGHGSSGVHGGGGGHGKHGGHGGPRHKDGDEVGKDAPKIGESNVGFKLLSLMGWSEGQHIGISSNGLGAPLTAIVKNSKLGLGATRQ